MALLNRDIDAMRSKTGIRAAVVEVLRELDVLPAKPKRHSLLRLVPTKEHED